MSDQRQSCEKPQSKGEEDLNFMHRQTGSKIKRYEWGLLVGGMGVTWTIILVSILVRWKRAELETEITVLQMSEKLV